jgi:hypothetical protein
MKYAFLGAIAALLFAGTVAAAPLPRINVGEVDTYTFEANNNSNFVTWVTWDTYYDPRKDLTIDITSPSGFTQHCDDSLNAKQICIIYGELEDGTYTIAVTNTGERNVGYGIEYGAGD